jgi:hypothetical protein
MRQDRTSRRFRRRPRNRDRPVGGIGGESAQRPTCPFLP